MQALDAALAAVWPSYMRHTPSAAGAEAGQDVWLTKLYLHALAPLAGPAEPQTPGRSELDREVRVTYMYICKFIRLYNVYIYTYTYIYSLGAYRHVGLETPPRPIHTHTHIYIYIYIIYIYIYMLDREVREHNRI